MFMDGAPIHFAKEHPKKDAWFIVCEERFPVKYAPHATMRQIAWELDETLKAAGY